MLPERRVWLAAGEADSLEEAKLIEQSVFDRGMPYTRIIATAVES